MPSRRDFLGSIAAISAAGAISGYAEVPLQNAHAAETTDRQFWLGVLKRLSEPVLGNLAEQKLKEKMPVESLPGSEAERREVATRLEAFGRLLSGIAPWLELTEDSSAEETKLRARFAELARQSLDSATNPQSRDFMNFTKNRQPVVDAAFLAAALIRAPNELWKKLDGRVKTNVYHRP